MQKLVSTKNKKKLFNSSLSCKRFLLIFEWCEKTFQQFSESRLLGPKLLSICAPTKRIKIKLNLHGHLLKVCKYFSWQFCTQNSEVNKLFCKKLFFKKTYMVCSVHGTVNKEYCHPLLFPGMESFRRNKTKPWYWQQGITTQHTNSDLWPSQIW